MFEYVFGFLVGTATTYICLNGQAKQFNKILDDINQKLNDII